MSEPTTPLERAQYIAHLMGGNGLSQNQQVALIAAELEKWSRADCFRAAGVMDPLTARLLKRPSSDWCGIVGMDGAMVVSR